jgi:riboflavin kinase/FMN adenylyltransferase
VEFIRGLHNLSPKHSGCVLTIGKFDGVHLGHQAVLQQLKQKALALSLPSAVMVFEPQPEEVFNPENAPARLSTLRDKIELLDEQGIDRLICMRFNQKFASMSPEAFIHDLLIDRLGVRFLVVGDDFRFGCKRAGDFTMLQEAGERENFDVVSTASFRVADCRISSTAIREALNNSDFERAENMQGKPFTISGKVIHGEKKGRTIGFPTANVLLKRHQSPLHGVYAVTTDVAGKQYQGVANIGHRPTLNGTRMQLEVHLFDFSGDLYGTLIHVVPVAKIRDEQRFSSFAELTQQIDMDAKQAKQLLKERYENVSRNGEALE